MTVSTTTNRVSGWSYDAVGNTLNDGLHTYTYDANNKVVQLDSGATVYKYDGLGERVMKVTASETIRYAMGETEYSSVSGWKKSYVHLGSEKLIQYSGGTTYFFHTDHLGTPKVITNMQGGVSETWDNYPFGEQWTKTGSTGNTHRFTGHLRDTESGNEYAGARYYSNVRGRWLSVDPVLGSARNPQELNRYAYVHNDPLGKVDPDGRQVLCSYEYSTTVATTVGNFRNVLTTNYYSCRDVGSLPVNLSLGMLAFKPQERPVGISPRHPALPGDSRIGISQDCINQFSVFLGARGRSVARSEATAAKALREALAHPMKIQITTGDTAKRRLEHLYHYNPELPLSGGYTEKNFGI